MADTPTTWLSGEENGEQAFQQQPAFELESAVEQNLQDTYGPDQDGLNIGHHGSGDNHMIDALQMEA